MARAVALGQDPDRYYHAGWLDRLRLEAVYEAAETHTEQARRRTVIDMGAGIFGVEVTYT